MKRARLESQPSFSRIVCGSPQVLGAFPEHAPTRRWWSLILKLHGKPVDAAMGQAATTRLVAEGFRFYATLYRLLGAIFGLLCPAFLALQAMDTSSGGLYWAAASLLAALYLWLVSGLGFAGARSYARGQEQGRLSLLAFMVMIVAFLSLFVAALSVTAQHMAWLPCTANLLGAALLFILGVGSYLIEILYLATQRPSATQ